MMVLVAVVGCIYYCRGRAKIRHQAASNLLITSYKMKALFILYFYFKFVKDYVDVR